MTAPSHPPAPEATRHAEADLPVGDAQEIELSRLVTHVYAESPPGIRARLLECLIRPLRPLGLAAIAAGAFGAFLHRDSWSQPHVSIDDASRYGPDQVLELVRYVEQVRPEVLAQVAGVVADSPIAQTSLSAALLLATLRLWWPGTSDR